MFNALSILLVSRYLYIRFSRERENYAREQEAQRSRRHRTQESEPESSMQAAHLARFTPVLVMQPDSKVCQHTWRTDRLLRMPELSSASCLLSCVV